MKQLQVLLVLVLITSVFVYGKNVQPQDGAKDQNEEGPRSEGVNNNNKQQQQPDYGNVNDGVEHDAEQDPDAQEYDNANEKLDYSMLDDYEKIESEVRQGQNAREDLGDYATVVKEPNKEGHNNNKGKQPGTEQVEKHSSNVPNDSTSSSEGEKVTSVELSMQNNSFTTGGADILPAANQLNESKVETINSSSNNKSISNQSTVSTLPSIATTKSTIVTAKQDTEVSATKANVESSWTRWFFIVLFGLLCVAVVTYCIYVHRERRRKKKQKQPQVATVAKDNQQQQPQAATEAQSMVEARDSSTSAISSSSLSLTAAPSDIESGGALSTTDKSNSNEAPPRGTIQTGAKAQLIAPTISPSVIEEDKDSGNNKPTVKNKTEKSKSKSKSKKNKHQQGKGSIGSKARPDSSTDGLPSQETNSSSDASDSWNTKKASKKRHRSRSKSKSKSKSLKSKSLKAKKLKPHKIESITDPLLKE